MMSSLATDRSIHGGPGRAGAFRPDIEGLRAVAVLAVVAYHARVPGLGGGYVGVDAFFVISGFLITTLLLGELRRSGGLSFVGFYARRIRRILPMAVVVAAVVVVASAAILSPLRARVVGGDAVATATFWLNYRLAARGIDYLTAGAAPSPLLHYWSLAVEEQFYLVWPAVLVAASWPWRRRAGRRAAGRAPDAGPAAGGTGSVPGAAGVAAVAAVIVVVSFAVSVRLTRSSEPWAFFSLASRAWEPGVGALLALGVGPLRRLGPRVAAPLGWAGLGALGLAAVRFDDRTPFPGWAALLPVLGAAAVVAAGAARPRGGPELLLGRRPFQTVGRLSFSWYLWHYPALILVAAALGHTLSVPAALAVCALALVVSAGSFALVEQPVRTSPGLGRRPVVTVGAGAAASAVVVVVAAVVAFTLPSLAGGTPGGAGGPAPALSAAGLAAALAQGATVTAVPPDLTPSLRAAGSSLPVIYHDGCHVSFTSTVQPPCVFGDPTSTTTVVLFGDSHAAQWFPALQAISRRRHWRLLSFTKAACPAVDLPMFNTTLRRTYTECTTWLHRTEARIVAERPALVVVASMRNYTDTTLAASRADFERGWEAGSVAVLRALRGPATRVVALGDTPLPVGNVPDCLAGHLHDVAACDQQPDRITNNPARMAAEPGEAATAGVARIDPTAWMCAAVCPVIVGSLLVYRDDSHMTPPFAEWISPLLEAALRPLVDPPAAAAPPPRPGSG